jgi:hypothetical protein
MDAAAAAAGSNAMLLPDEVLSNILDRLDRADIVPLHLVCHRLRWRVLKQRLAEKSTFSMVMAALNKLRVSALPRGPSGANMVTLECTVEFTQAEQQCSMHSLHESVTQQSYVEALVQRMLQQQHQQQQQQQQEQQQRQRQPCLFSQLPFTALEPADAMATAEQVCEAPRSQFI